ncbi:MAG: response regulator, partial [Desulfobacteraceae bacterium]
MQQVQEPTGAGAKWPQILIMEDELSVAKGLELILTEEGYTVDLAMSGRSALECFDRKQVDLLIADLRLPDIDGMEVIKQVKRRRPDIGVIVITGYSTIPSAVEAIKLGAADYLSKPFSEDDIVSAVKVALDTKGLTKPDQAAAGAGPAAAVLEPLPQDLQRVKEIMTQIRQDFSGHREELIAILQRFQRQLGFIPLTALREIARFTRMPEASVYGVATFYEQFRLHPVGRHIVKVCRGTACHVKGAER